MKKQELEKKIKEAIKDFYTDHKDLLESEFGDSVEENDIFNYCMDIDTNSEWENLQFSLGYIYALKEILRSLK